MAMSDREHETVWGAIGRLKKRVAALELEIAALKAKQPKRGKNPRPADVAEVEQYAAHHGYELDAAAFYDFYEANGWCQGRSGKPIKDWHACVRTWMRMQQNPRYEPMPKYQPAKLHYLQENDANE